MSRRAQEINPKCKIRLNQLCTELGITQKQLAVASMISENTLSKIATGKSPLSEKIAEDIIKVCPGYRVEWLRGLDDEPHKARFLHIPGLEDVNRYCAAIKLLKSIGISVGQSTDNGMFSLADRGFLPCLGAEIKKGDTIIWKGTVEEITSVLLEICEFSLFKIERLCNTNRI
jgi:transcriptional regulator with XRE-family HTH domain